MASRYRWRAAAVFLALAGLIVSTLVPLVAHEVPNDVLIQAYIKPEGQRVRMLVRVPLVALRDMTWPFKSPEILDISRADRELHDAATLWLGDESTLYEGDRALPSPGVEALRATLPTDRAFESYDQALALVTGPPPAETDQISIKEGFLDVLFEYPGTNEHSRFSFEPRWGRLGIHALTTVQVLLPDGSVRSYELQGDPGLVRLDPTVAQAAWRFFKDGVAHILDGVDHLLFIFCLVLPFRRLRDLGVVVASFTVAYSATLLASGYGLEPQVLWFPSLIDTSIATSIVYLAAENAAGTTVHRRWLATAVFGLVHGFGFAFALKQTLQFGGTHIVASLLSFNLGIEIGMILILALAIPALNLLFRFVVPERTGVVLLSAMAAHSAWHWMTTRGALLVQYQFTWPDMTPAFFVSVIRWLMVLVTAAALTWLVGMLRAPDSRIQSERDRLSA